MVATAGGVTLALAPLAALCCLAVWIVCFAVLRYASVASIVTAVALPPSASCSARLRRWSVSLRSPLSPSSPSTTRTSVACSPATSRGSAAAAGGPRPDPHASSPRAPRRAASGCRRRPGAAARRSGARRAVVRDPGQRRSPACRGRVLRSASSTHPVGRRRSQPRRWARDVRGRGRHRGVVAGPGPHPHTALRPCGRSPAARRPTSSSCACRRPRPSSATDRAVRRRIANAVTGLDGLGPHYKYVVYYDGPVDTDEGLRPGRRRLRRAGCRGRLRRHLRRRAERGDGSPRAPARLGAVPSPGPQHSCGAEDPAHACDSNTDIMWPFATLVPFSSLILDVNRDDYYGHSGALDRHAGPRFLRRLDAQGAAGVALTGTGSRHSATFRGSSCATRAPPSGTRARPSRSPRRRAGGQRFVRWGGGWPCRAGARVHGLARTGDAGERAVRARRRTGSCRASAARGRCATTRVASRAPRAASRLSRPTRPRASSPRPPKGGGSRPGRARATGRVRPARCR